MGGLGSGRPSGCGRGKVEACRSIDVNRLNRDGCLKPGWLGFSQWTRHGEKVASIIIMLAGADLLSLSYRGRIGGGDWEDVKESVRIVRVPCRFGGARPYFICPGVVNGIACGRRVAKLYEPGRYFLVSALLSPRACKPERGGMGPHAPPREQDQATPRRRSRNGLAVSAQAERHVAANL